jgi:hypothetical protein
MAKEVFSIHGLRDPVLKMTADFADHSGCEDFRYSIVPIEVRSDGKVIDPVMTQKPWKVRSDVEYLPPCTLLLETSFMDMEFYVVQEVGEMRGFGTLIYDIPPSCSLLIVRYRVRGYNGELSDEVYTLHSRVQSRFGNLR